MRSCGLVVEVLRQDRLDDVLPEVVLDHALGTLTVLRGDQQLLDPDRPAVDVAHRDLRLAVRAQVVEVAGLAHVGQALGELVRQRDRQRHQLLGLVGGVPEHHPLVARARNIELVVVVGVGARLVGLVDALGDVRRLLVDRVQDGARVRREAEVGVDVADLADRLASDLLDVDVGLGRDLAGDDHEAGVDERLARDATVRVLGEDRVQDAVGDLVRDLVGMTLGHRLGREQEAVVLAHGMKRERSTVETVPVPAACAPMARTRTRSSRMPCSALPGPMPVSAPKRRS